MGSAITFTDKIANKNCQNVQPVCLCTRGGNSNSNHSHCTDDHVDLNYYEDLFEPEDTLNSFSGFSASTGRNSRLSINVNRKSEPGKEWREKEDQEEYEYLHEDEEADGESESEHEDQDQNQNEQEYEEKAKSPRGKVETLLSTLGYCIMGRRCLCDTIKPILKLSQLLGVIPLKLKHQRNSEGENTGSCELTFRWTSLSTILNTLFILVFLLISPFAHTEIKNRMSSVFSGTDLYAFSLQTMAMVLETTILLSVGRLYKGKFSRGWSSLNEVFHAICDCDSADDLKQIKLGSYITALIIMVEGVGFFSFMYWTGHRAIGIYHSCSALLIGTFVISLTLIIPYIMSTLFLFICLLIRCHFLKISDMLRTAVSKHNSPKLSSKIDALRVLHEQLCQTVTYFEDFFGFQVLLTLCTCCFTVTVGAYACILKGEDISSPEGKELTGAWLMQLYCAAIFILLILISGQLVTNAAASPGPVLNAIPLSELDEKSQTQVTAFLSKISAFPTNHFLYHFLFPTTFLASAATNITTYLLVLMQFKLGFEQDSDAESENLTMPGAGFEMDASTEPIFYNVTVPESLAFLTESL